VKHYSDVSERERWAVEDTMDTAGSADCCCVCLDIIGYVCIISRYVVVSDLIIIIKLFELTPLLRFAQFFVNFLHKPN